jgi:alkanesulfonate monooxygenase SsuD/methylene tetrahydromethanopterin reductase-like flavin-dependent oxidoreductase (luciferase family)
MAPRIGYLLPTREWIMEGRAETGSLLSLAERAEGLGYDSVWIGDSIVSRPRHDPLTLLAAVAGRLRRIGLGTAVLLPALRHPVVLAHQLATIDRIGEGRLIVGVGIAQDLPRIRAEFAALGVPFEKRVGRMLEALHLCRALWTGEPVDWEGRWTFQGQTVAPTPHRPGGPPLLGGGMVPAALARAARHFDGWFPNGPQPAKWGEQWREVQRLAQEAGRDPAQLTGAVYLTLALDEDAGRAQLRIDSLLTSYYNAPAEVLRRQHTFYAGPAEGAARWLADYAAAGVSQFVLRFAGDHEWHLDTVAGLCAKLGW